MMASALEHRSATPTRVLVINPNTNAQVTARVRAAAVRLASPGVEFTVTNPARGPQAIENAAARAEAEPHVMDMLRAAHPQAYDAFVMACFDDIAIAEAMALTGRPVVGAADAGIAAAQAATRGRFAIVTTVVSAVAVIQRLLARYAPDADCVVRAAGIGVAEAADAGDATQSRLVATVEQALHRDGAHAVLLASGGLTGWAEPLAQRFGIPVVDGVEAALRAAVRSGQRERA